MPQEGTHGMSQITLHNPPYGAIHLLRFQKGGGGVEKLDQNANAVREVA